MMAFSLSKQLEHSRGLSGSQILGNSERPPPLRLRVAELGEGGFSAPNWSDCMLSKRRTATAQTFHFWFSKPNEPKHDLRRVTKLLFLLFPAGFDATFVDCTLCFPPNQIWFQAQTKFGFKLKPNLVCKPKMVCWTEFGLGSNQKWNVCNSYSKNNHWSIILLCVATWENESIRTFPYQWLGNP